MVYYFVFITLCLNQVAIILEAKHDVKKQKRGGTIKHGQSSLFRGIAWVLASVLINQRELVLIAIQAFILGFQYWLSFDPIHNKFTGQLWYYTNNGFFDSILSGRDNRFKRLFMKIGLLLLFCVIYVLIHERINNQ